MEKYLHKRVLNIPLYRGKFIIVISNDEQKVKDSGFPLFETDELYAHALEVNYEGYHGFTIVLNFENEFRSISHSTIFHEIIHIIHYIASSRGFKSDFNNDEPLTYLGEWLVDEVYKFTEEIGMKIINHQTPD